MAWPWNSLGAGDYLCECRGVLSMVWQRLMYGVCLAVMTTLAAAEVEVGGVAYDHVDPGEPFVQADQPREEWSPPSPTRAEAAAGFIPYYRPAPEELRPWSRPRREECVRGGLRMFAAKGEVEPMWVALYALRDLRGISARIEGLAEGVRGELFVMHFWPQRTSWRSRQYYITPELLLPYDGERGVAWFPSRYVLEEKPFDVAAGTTGAVWVRIEVGRTVAAGEYSFRLRLQAKGRRALTIPMRLRVWPFELRKPDNRFWLIYGDVWRWRRMSDQQRWLDAKDYASHGMDGIVEMPLGRADLSGLKTGRVKWDIKQTQRYLELLQQAGMRGPWVMSGRLAAQVRDALGIKANLNEPWPGEVRRGVQLAAGAAADAYRKLGIEWYFYGWDEPGEENVYAVEQYRNWHEGGAPVYVTICRPGFWASMAKYLDAPCFGAYMINNPEGWKRVSEECRRLGKEMWWYGSGAYIGQEGRMFPNRFLAGYLFWKTGARCQVSWTYTRPHEDPFNDFDGVKANRAEPKEQATVYPWWEKPGDWGSYRGPIQTVQWEALREGVDDFCYLYALSRGAARAAAAPGRERARAGRKAKRALRDIAAALPWSTEVGSMGFDNQACQSLRWLVAQQVELLEKGTLGQPGSRVPERPLRVYLEVVPGGRAEAQTLPAVSIPRLSRAPVVDGKLDEHVWLEAARVADFRNTRTGEPVKPGTQAWLGYDDRALYVGFRCEEPDMDSLVAERQGRDAEGIWLDDGVEVFVDPSGERRRYAHFIINVAGAMLDEIGQDTSWDSAAQARVTTREGEWKCELAIPWRDLEAAGLSRKTVMAMNLCRNRFAGRGSGWRHAAWSATYAWYHVPRRFGVALLEEGDIGLVSLRLPTKFGRQMLGVGLANRTRRGQLVQVEARVKYSTGEAEPGSESLVVEVPAGEREVVNVPVDLSMPGSATIELSWGPRGGAMRTASFAVVVPEPATLPTRLLTVGEDGELRAVVELNAAEAEGELYLVGARLHAGGRLQWRGTVACAAGRSARLEGKARIPWMLGWLELSVSRGGRALWKQRVPVMPRYSAIVR